MRLPRIVSVSFLSHICIGSESCLNRILVIPSSYMHCTCVIHASHMSHCTFVLSVSNAEHICIVSALSWVIPASFHTYFSILSASSLHYVWFIAESFLSDISIVSESCMQRENCNSSASYVRQICNVSESYLRRKFLISTRVISVSYRRISVYFLWLTSPQSFLSLLLIWTDLNARSAVKGSEGLAGRRKKGRLSLLLSFFPSSVALLSVTLLAFYCPRAIRDQWGLVSFYHTVS